MKRLTPVLAVEAIEPVLAFWVDRLGFSITTEVPHEDRIGFVILQKGNIELMYQTLASIHADVGAIGDHPLGGTALFIEVEDLNAIEKALHGIDPITPRRQTFYGSDELIFREPGGNVVTFAQFGG